MTIIHFGTESEFVKIQLPDSFFAEGFSQADVEIAVRCFSGNIRAWLDVEDIVSFTAQLRTLYETLKGEAKLSPLDAQFTLKFVGTAGGHINMTGVAWSEATYGNKLSFFLDLDQTFLPTPLQALESL